MTYLLWRAAQEKPRPRRLTFVMDVSGSMYRFNGHDGRLNKMLETTCLVMEAHAAKEPHATSHHLLVLPGYHPLRHSPRRSSGVGTSIR